MTVKSFIFRNMIQGRVDSLATLAFDIQIFIRVGVSYLSRVPYPFLLLQVTYPLICFLFPFSSSFYFSLLLMYPYGLSRRLRINNDGLSRDTKNLNYGYSTVT